MSDHWLINWSVRCYWALLCLYPARFRQDYAPMMRLDFRDTCRGRHEKHGIAGLMGAWCWALGDFCRNLIAEYARVAGEGLRSQPVQRGCEISASLGGLAVVLPFLPLVAMLIKLDSPGPVFFVQQRTGLHGKPFPMLKLRTMADRPQGKQITRVGHVLRALRVDELPQFVNVLRGEMALRGPRPNVWRHDASQENEPTHKPGLIPRRTHDAGL